MRDRERDRERLLNVVELEERSGASRHTWRTWIREGRVACVRIGRLVRVREEDYLSFVAANRREKRDGR